MAEQVTAYRCQHCGKLFAREGNAVRHEREICRSPKCRSCHTCCFSKLQPFDDPYGRDGGWYCSHANNRRNDDRKPVRECPDWSKRTDPDSVLENSNA